MNRARAVVAGCLLVVGLVLVPFANAAVWGRRHLLDTPRFVALTSAVVRTPGVRSALADRITDDLSTRSTALAIASPLVHAAAARVIESDAFLTVFDPAVASLHRQLLAGDDQLSLDLQALLPLIREELGQVDRRLASLVPDVALGGIVVADRADAPALWDGVDVARRAWWITPLVVVALLGAAIAVANRHLTMAALVGGGVTFACLVMLVALAIARASLSGVTSGADQRLVRGVWDAVVDSLQTQTLVVMALGILLAVVAGVARAIRGRTPRLANVA
jgi:hypothetical protein